MPAPPAGTPNSNSACALVPWPWPCPAWPCQTRHLKHVHGPQQASSLSCTCGCTYCNARRCVPPAWQHHNVQPCTVLAGNGRKACQHVLAPGAGTEVTRVQPGTTSYGDLHDVCAGNLMRSCGGFAEGSECRYATRRSGRHDLPSFVRGAPLWAYIAKMEALHAHAHNIIVSFIVFFTFVKERQSNNRSRTEWAMGMMALHQRWTRHAAFVATFLDSGKFPSLPTLH